VEVEFVRRSIAGLRETQKLLLYCVAVLGVSTPTQLYQHYNERAKKLGLSPLTSRRLSALLRELELLGLVEISKKGRGRGRGVKWLVYRLSRDK